MSLRLLSFCHFLLVSSEPCFLLDTLLAAKLLSTCFKMHSSSPQNDAILNDSPFLLTWAIVAHRLCRSVIRLPGHFFILIVPCQYVYIMHYGYSCHAFISSCSCPCCPVESSFFASVLDLSLGFLAFWFQYLISLHYSVCFLTRHALSTRGTHSFS